MKLAEIEVGKTYYVRIPADVDGYLHMMDSGRRPRGMKRERVHAEVIEVGVEREALIRTTWGGISGSPRVVVGSRTVSGGVRIRFKDNTRDREEIVPSSAIKWEVAA